MIFYDYEIHLKAPSDISKHYVHPNNYGSDHFWLFHGTNHAWISSSLCMIFTWGQHENTVKLQNSSKTQIYCSVTLIYYLIVSDKFYVKKVPKTEAEIIIDYLKSCSSVKLSYHFESNFNT